MSSCSRLRSSLSRRDFARQIIRKSPCATLLGICREKGRKESADHDRPAQIGNAGSSRLNSSRLPIFDQQQLRPFSICMARQCRECRNGLSAGRLSLDLESHSVRRMAFFRLMSERTDNIQLISDIFLCYVSCPFWSNPRFTIKGTALIMTQKVTRSASWQERSILIHSTNRMYLFRGQTRWPTVIQCRCMSFPKGNILMPVCPLKRMAV
jgi:hypothetical protein